MPVQIYRCKCKEETEERLVKFSDQDDQKCKECGEKLEMIPSFGNFKLKGSWFKTVGRY